VKPLAITLGDPAGIGAEIVEKALRELDVPARIFGEVRGPVRYGAIQAAYGRIALNAIDEAVEAILRGECAALVTAPIHKQSIALAGAQYPGHTELLAAKAGLTRYGHEFAMYFDSPSLRSVLLSVHRPLREAVTEICATDVAALARLTAREFARLYGKAPRIGVAGVNPHAGESGKIGHEEIDIIAPAISDLQASLVTRHSSLSVSGPHSPDTVFHRAIEGEFDAVLCMYHDQALIPLKLHAFHSGVNTTLGLPFPRTSPDHGTAFEIAGKGIAKPDSMIAAINLAVELAQPKEKR
jgi:4-hydroxythreonine-4-phosphate dehydrogenase